MGLSETAPEGIQEKLRPVDAAGFTFACHPGVPCFTECCRDLTLVLTPYDVMRLKNRLGLPAGEFLDRFTDCRFEDGRNLPKMYLLMNEDERKTCPFVSPRGCTVYEDRPSACRIYPIARASRMHRVHGTLIENYFTLREEHCRGFEEKKSWKIEEWLKDQGLEEYYRFNDAWMEIITHPTLRNANLNDRQQQLFYLGSYNCDKFREMVIRSPFLGIFDVPDDEAEKIRTDDAALLMLAFKWIKFSLLGEPALRLRKDT